MMRRPFQQKVHFDLASKKKERRHLVITKATVNVTTDVTEPALKGPTMQNIVMLFLCDVSRNNNLNQLLFIIENAGV